MQELDPNILLYVILGGIIPAVFWLKFWLRESNHGEPRGLIFGTFLAGMLAVIIAIFFEHNAICMFKESKILEESQFCLFEPFLPSGLTLLQFFLLAFIEEVVKFFAAYFVALKTRFIDEPIDATIYLVSAALGFAALENIFYIVKPFSDPDGGLITGIIATNTRFIGPSLLHIIASGAIGIAIGFAFYKSKKIKKIFLILGIFFATLLHTLFNSFIISNERYTLLVFGVVWIGLIATIVILEKIKRIKNINL